MTRPSSPRRLTASSPYTHRQPHQWTRHSSLYWHVYHLNHMKMHINEWADTIYVHKNHAASIQWWQNKQNVHSLCAQLLMMIWAWKLLIHSCWNIPSDQTLVLQMNLNDLPKRYKTSQELTQWNEYAQQISQQTDSKMSQMENLLWISDPQKAKPTHTRLTVGSNLMHYPWGVAMPTLPKAFSTPYYPRPGTCDNWH